MPDPALTRLLARFLPDRVRDDLFAPSAADLHIDYVTALLQAPTPAARAGCHVRYRLRLLSMFLDCLRFAPSSMLERRAERRAAGRPPARERIRMTAYTVRHAIRLLVRERGFTATAVATLALGLGLNLAIFTVIEAVMLRPLPYPDAGELVILNHRDTRTGLTKDFIAVGDYVDLHARQAVFETLTSYANGGLTVTSGGEPFRASILAAGPGLLDTLRVSPIRGRLLEPADSRPGAPPVVMIGEELWEKVFASDSNVVGRSITVGATPRQIVGVSPRGLRFPAEAKVELILPQPLPLAAPANRKNGWFFVVARLKPGVTIDAAASHLAELSQAFAAEHPESNQGSLYYPVALREHLLGDTRKPLLLLLGAVAVVLVIACANVGNLLLARALTRHHEMSVRVALGAGRGRLVLQLLAENLALTTTAAAAGLAIAHWGVPALLALVPARLTIPGLSDVGLNASVIGYAAAVSIVAAGAFALLSALTLGRSEGSAALTAQTRVSGGRSTRRATSALIVVEVALSVGLLIGAGLIVRSFSSLLAVNPGFTSDGVALVDVSLPAQRYLTPASRQVWFTQAFTRLRSLPGVESVGAAAVTPLTGNNWTLGFERVDRPVSAGTRPPDVGWQSASGGYFQALQIPLLSGRLFDERDASTTHAAVIVSRELERLYFDGESALGRKVKTGEGEAEIVGVVGDIRRAALVDQPRAEMYFPFEQSPPPATTLFIRTSRDPAVVMTDLRQTLRSLEPGLVISTMRTMTGVAQQSIASTRLVLWLLAIFATVALVLAAVGVYGVMSYVVKQRTREFGTRVALGATRRDILFLVMRQGATMTAAGVAIGLVTGLVLARGLSSMLYGVGSTDPATMSLSVLALAVATMAACYLPARRATRLDAARTLTQG